MFVQCADRRMDGRTVGRCFALRVRRRGRVFLGYQSLPSFPDRIFHLSQACGALSQASAAAMDLLFAMPIATSFGRNAFERVQLGSSNQRRFPRAKKLSPSTLTLIRVNCRNYTIGIHSFQLSPPHLIMRNAMQVWFLKADSRFRAFS